MRSLAPKDAIAYLEINDLTATLNDLTDNKVFHENTTAKPDFSSLKGIQAVVAVTGFETSEKQVTDENSILNFTPKFVAIAETHAWKPAAVSIAENQIGKFARETYGENVKLEKAEKGDAKFFAWTNADGRKIFCAVSQGTIYIGNDEDLIDKSLAVKRGEAESLLSNGNLEQARERTNGKNLLAFGYISAEAIKQFADMAGVSAAVKATDSDEERNLIAQILPKILQNTTEEIAWTAQKSGNKIEDNFFVHLNDETTSVFNETLSTSGKNHTNAADFLPADVISTTAYDLKNPLIAWRSLLLVTAKNTEDIAAKYLVQFSNHLLEPYGISNAEMFLSAIDSEIMTANFDAEGENSAVIVTGKNVETIKNSIAEINFKSPPEKLENAQVWKSEESNIIAAFVENKLILGNDESVLRCLQAKNNGQNFTKNQNYQQFAQSNSTTVTFATDSESADKIISVLGNAKAENQKIYTNYLTETRITNKGIERKIISDFGFLGTILEQLKD